MKHIKILFTFGLFYVANIYPSCAYSISQEAQYIIRHAAYSDLTSKEKDLVEKIIRRADKSENKKYYFYKLNLLLNTKSNPQRITSEMNRKEIDESVKETKRERRELAEESKIDLEDYMNQEELYEQDRDHKWYTYHPTFFSPYFYVSHDDYTDILVNIRVHLVGEYKLIEKILSLEDAVEKHIAVPGFSVNLVFTGETDSDVFVVNVNPNNWAHSYNWAGGYMVIAHELFHLMGLPDEYDKIENHAENPNMSRLQRLYQFLAQIDEELPSDAKDGIMCYCARRPLQRHVCAAVGLGENCIKARIKEFGN